MTPISTTVVAAPVVKAAITAPGISIAGLEQVYDTLASAIDQAGPDKATLFLVKLALLNANALADANVFKQQVNAALLDL